MIKGNTINAASRGRLTDPACGTMLHVPTARIHHQQTSVLILQHIGKMDVRIIRRYEIERLHCIERALGRESMPNYLARVVLGGKQVSAHFGWESVAAIKLQAAVSYRGKKGKRREEGGKLEERRTVHRVSRKETPL